MKAKIIGTIIALVVSLTITYAQSNIEIQKSYTNSSHIIALTDSIYYGCVPCCQACSEYTTDKPGECPHCGMTLEKRIYQATIETHKKAQKTTKNKGICKPIKSKKQNDK